MNMSQHYFPPFECTHILPSDNFCISKLFVIRKEFPTLSIFKHIFNLCMCYCPSCIKKTLNTLIEDCALFFRTVVWFYITSLKKYINVELYLIYVSLFMQVASVELWVKRKDHKILLCSLQYKINFSEWRAGKTVHISACKLAVQDTNSK